MLFCQDLSWINVSFHFFQMTRKKSRLDARTKRKIPASALIYSQTPKRKKTYFSPYKSPKPEINVSQFAYTQGKFNNKLSTPCCVSRTPKSKDIGIRSVTKNRDDLKSNTKETQVNIGGDSVPNADNASSRDLLTIVLNKLETAGCATDFLSFLECVADDKFPLDNISLLLFLDTVRFFNTSTTNQMRYRQQTKTFWNAGRRLFHNKFLYFMGGPKNIGQLENGKTVLTPDKSSINFAVPDLKALSGNNEIGFQIPKRLDTGCLTQILDKISPCVGDSYMLCADGKKVTSGLDSKGGDVDMFGCEDGVKLGDKKSVCRLKLKQ